MSTQSTEYNILDIIHPIGSIYMNRYLVDPSALFGGVWERIKDRFLMAKGDMFPSDGGNENNRVTLTSDNLPVHSHTITPSGTITSPVFEGTTSEITAQGTHRHKMLMFSGSGDSIYNVYAGSLNASNAGYSDSREYKENYYYGGDLGPIINYSGDLSWSTEFTPSGSIDSSFSGTEKSTEDTDSSIIMEIVPPYETIYAWVRIE